MTILTIITLSRESSNIFIRFYLLCLKVVKANTRKLGMAYISDTSENKSLSKSHSIINAHNAVFSVFKQKCQSWLSSQVGSVSWLVNAYSSSAPE